MNLEQSLRALAEDDAAARVPAHVDAAVMAAWEAQHREERSRDHTARWQQRRRAIIASAIAAACAASLVAVAIVERTRPVEDPPPAPRRAAIERPARLEATTTVAVPAGAGTLALPAQRQLAAPPKRVRRVSAPLPEASAAYVLVPDAGMESPLTMMRVRMSRSAFSRLGVPIANPDGDGMVDVDVLVGEDGVARSIRRAAAVDAADVR